MEPSLGKFWYNAASKIPAAVAASEEPILRYFNYHDAHPVGLIMTLMGKFGLDWFDWEAETLKKEILESFKATSISEQNWQKIQAIKTLIHTVGCWKEWHIFEKILQALNNNVPRFDIAQRCTVAQLMAGVDIVNSIREEEFSDEVCRYIAACAMDDGITFLPPPLSFAQTVLSKPMYQCLDCGTIDTDDSDGRCDFCTGRFQDDHPFNFKPAETVDSRAGINVTRYLSINPTPVKTRFEEMRLMDRESLPIIENSCTDTQTAKLLVAYDYMQLRQKQLIEQLEELKTWAAI